jgi:hypothetical protein
MISNLRAVMTLSFWSLLVASVAAQQPDEQSGGANEANNPLTPKITINLQDYYTPSFLGLPNKSANQFLLRGLLPHDLFGAPQLFRFTIPLANVPAPPGGQATGIGDITLMDLFMFPGKTVSFGVGPMLIAPTASSDALGSGKWQAGLAAIAVAPQSWGLIGGLATYQQSFAGDSSRPNVRLLTAQPILFYNLPDGFYLRSSGTLNFDLEKHSYYIPVGFGLGKVFNIGDGATMNAFLEPQYTVAYRGTAPRWQIYAGINFQFPIKK